MVENCQFNPDEPCHKVACFARYIAAHAGEKSLKPESPDPNDSSTTSSVTERERTNWSRYRQIGAIIRERLKCATEKNIT